MRLFGKERDLFLRTNARTDFNYLAAFLIKPSRYPQLRYIKKAFASTDSLYSPYLLQWELTTHELKLLKPYIDTDDKAGIFAMVCGLRFLGVFGLLNETRVKQLKDCSLGLRLLAQVSLYTDLGKVKNSLNTAEFIYESLQSLMQSPEVLDFMHQNPPNIKASHDTPSAPAVVAVRNEQHSLSNKDIVEIAPIKEYGEQRRKEIRILDPDTREIKYTLLESKLHDRSKIVALLPSDRLLLVSSYLDPLEFHQSILIGGLKIIHKLKVWDLKTSTCIKESKENYADTMCYKLLAGNRIAYQEENKLIIYDLDKQAVEIEWKSPVTQHAHYELVIGEESADSLSVYVNGVEIALAKQTPSMAFALARHWLFSQPQQESDLYLLEPSSPKP